MIKDEVLNIFGEEDFFEGRSDDEAFDLIEAMLNGLPEEIASGTMINIPTEYGSIDIDEMTLTHPDASELKSLDDTYFFDYGIEDTDCGSYKCYPGESVFSIYIK